MALWYAETISMSGKWAPQTTPYEPQTTSRGGHLRESRIGSLGRRIRAIHPVAPEHAALDLTALQAIYGPPDLPPVPKLI